MTGRQVQASIHLTAEENDLYRILLFDAVQEKNGQPFLSKAFRRLIPVSAPGSGKLTIDRDWRVYIDFQHAKSSGLEETLSQLHHSIWHLLRDHQNRTSELPSAPQGYDKEQLANFAADLEINDDIVDLLPKEAFIPGEGYFSHYKKNDTLENYYQQILSELPQLQEDFSNIGESLESSDDEEDNNDDEQQDVRESENSSNKSDQQDEKPDSPEKSEEDAESKNQEESDGEDEDSEPGTEDSGNEESDNQEGDPSQGGNERSDDEQDVSNEGNSQSSDHSTSGNPSSAQQNGFPQQHKTATPEGSSELNPEPVQKSEQESRPQFPECGDAAGNPDMYDLGENDAETMSEAEEEQLLKEIAADIEEWERENKGVGSGSSNRKNWAKKKLATQYISWKQELRGAFKQSFALTRGKLTYARNRPARRQPVPDVMYPALRAPQPTLGIGIDVSGSNIPNLTTVLHEIVKITQAANVRGKNVEAFAVDVKASEPVIVNNPLKILDSFPVGGGTRMAPGYKKLAEMAKDVSLLITDGYVNDFPSKLPTHPGKPRTKFLTCIILPERNQHGNFLIATVEKAVGSWSKVIPIYTSELKDN